MVIRIKKKFITMALITVIVLGLIIATQSQMIAGFVMSKQSERAVLPTQNTEFTVYPTTEPTREPTKPKVAQYPPCTGQNSKQTIYVSRQECETNYTDCGFRDGTWRLMTINACKTAQEQELALLKVKQPTSQTMNEPKIDCLLSTGTYKLSLANCAYMKSFEAGLAQDMEAYKQKNNEIIQEYQNKVNSYPTYSPGNIDTSLPQPSFPQLIVKPTNACQPIGNDGRYELCPQ